MHLLYLSHKLCDNVKARVRNDPQQSHQVFVLELPGKIGDTLKEENKLNLTKMKNGKTFQF